MDSFLSDLYLHCTEQSPFPQDPEQEKARNAYALLQEQVQTAMGEDFLSRYQYAEFCANACEHKAAFFQGLQAGAQFMLAVLKPQQSPPVSRP